MSYIYVCFSKIDAQIASLGAEGEIKKIFLSVGTKEFLPGGKTLYRNSFSPIIVQIAG